MNRKSLHARLGTEPLATRLMTRPTQGDVAARVGCCVPTVRLAESGNGIPMTFSAPAEVGMVLDGDSLPGGPGIGPSLLTLRQPRDTSRRQLSRMTSVCKETLAALDAGRDCRMPNVVQVARKLGVVLRLRNAGKPRAFYSTLAESSADEAFTMPADLLQRPSPLAGGRFTLAPCSPTRDRARAPVRARTHYTEEDDGLALAWDGDVFMNPPYGRGTKDRVAKARREVEDGNAGSVIGLLPARTDTAWWHDSVSPAARAWLLRGRLRFGGEDGGAAPFASALVLWGGDEALLSGIAEAFPMGTATYVSLQRGDSR